MKKKYTAAPQLRIKEAKPSNMICTSIAKAGNAANSGITSADAKWRDYDSDDEDNDLW